MVKKWVWILCLLLAGGCRSSEGWFAPSPSPPATLAPSPTAPALPDLILRTLSPAYEDPGNCEGLNTRLGVHLEVTNRGDAPAGPFIVEVAGAWQNVEAGLPAGDSISLWFSITDEQLNIFLDAQNQVTESNEQDNHITRTVILPAIPLACQVTPTPSPQVAEPLFTMEGHTAKVLTVAFSPDGNLVASGSVDNTMRLWRVGEGSLLRTMYGHPFPVLTLAFSPSGRDLVTGSTDSLVRLWRVSDGQLVSSLAGHGGSILSLAYTPDGQTLASSAEDYTVRLWRPATGRLSATIDEGMSEVVALMFSPNGETLAWAENSGQVRLWRLARSGAPGGWQGIFQETTQPAASLAFSSDGALLACGFEDGVVRIWDMASQEQVFMLEGHAGAVHGLAFAPGRDILLTGSHDRSLRLWRLDRETRQAATLLVFSGHTGPVTSVAFSPAGDLAASGSADSTVRVWAIPQE